MIVRAFRNTYDAEVLPKPNVEVSLQWIGTAYVLLGSAMGSSVLLKEFALEIVAESAGNYDLILSDFHFPDGDFKEIYSVITAHKGLSDIPLVVQSATAAESDIEYIKGNNLGFLLKPFGIMDLKELVEAHRVKQIKD